MKKAGLLLIFLWAAYAYAQQDTTTVAQDTAVTPLKTRFPDAPSVKLIYEYDPEKNLYIKKYKVGDYDVGYPAVLTPREYFALLQREQINKNFKETNDAIAGKDQEKQKDLLPQFYVNSKFFESLFGGNNIVIEPRGTFELDLGVRYTRRDNPAIPVRNRTNFTPDLNQRISMGLTGRIGKRLNLNLNYDTQSMFQFNNQVKLDFNLDEDAILQKIEVGNVNMQTANSLLTGPQNLMGLKTVMKFGNTEITLVGAEQKSSMQIINARGGEVLEDFEKDILGYDDNRHFFLAQYFRDRYDQALERYPYINSQVRITRVEVWITNRNSNPDNVRNIVAIQDLGESYRIGLDNPPPGYIVRPGALPDNNVNLMNPEAIGTPGSLLNPNIRQIATVDAGFSGITPVNGKDYVALENAVKLDSTQYTLYPKLGYISLRRKLNPDEVLAVAFEYSVGGKVYKVGEFTDDGIVYPQTLVVKLLKSNIVDTREPAWDLMMKNIYALNAYGISQEDFMMHILYADPTPLNYINPVGSTPLPPAVKDKILLHVFHMDELNTSLDPQPGGDGFFDFIPGITVDPQNALIKFTTVEPFGRYLFEKLRLDPGESYDDPHTWNANQAKYVFKELYTLSPSQARQFPEKNKFLLKGKYKSSMGGGINIGGFNIPRGSVHVTAGGRELVEGVDYVVNYQAGRVEIINPALKASNVPIQVRVEQSDLFQQSTKIFTGIDIQHRFNENFTVGATYLKLKEKPITWKADYGYEPLNNALMGMNGNFSTSLNFLTKWVNYLPYVKTDAESRLTLRSEMAYLKPGLAEVSDIAGESASLIEDFESAQSQVDLTLPYPWKLSPTPARFPESRLIDNWEYGKNRAKLAWYFIDPVFYSNNPPPGIDNQEISKDENRPVRIDELFDRDIQAGTYNLTNTLNLAYFPDERGPYNYDTRVDPATGKLLHPEQRWAGIFRPMTITDFEQANVQYITFWVMDPFYNNPVPQTGGKLYINLGYIKEDILYDGRKQYENGLPGDGGTANTVFTAWGKVPVNQSLTYAFSDDPAERANQDVGLDGLRNDEEQTHFASFLNALPPAVRTTLTGDPSGDDFVHYLDAQGGIVERYKNFNNTQGNTPVSTNNANAGETYPDTEDIDRDQTMNTIDAYFEYEIPIRPGLTLSDPYVKDIKETTYTDATRRQRTARWIQFKVPITEFTSRYGNINDFRSIKFMRLYLTGFDRPVVLRFATLDLVRSDWRVYQQTLDPNDPNPSDDPTTVEVTSVSSEENQTRTGVQYVSPPGIVREEIYQNNQLIRQNEQALSIRVCDLEPKDARGAFKYVAVDMRQFKNLKMFIHAESIPGQPPLADGDMEAFLRFGTDLSQNFYEIRLPLKITSPGTSDPEEVWPVENRMELRLELLQKLKLDLIRNRRANPADLILVDEAQLDPAAAGRPNRLTIGIKGNPDFSDVRVIMVGVRNRTSSLICGEAWFNELRLTEMKNEGGWATQGSADLTLADLATFNFAGGLATSGFGPLEQGPLGRSVENKYHYTFNSALNVGKFLPPKWNLTIPVNYTVTKQFIRPEYDPVHRDILLDDRLAAAQTPQERDSILNVARDIQSYKSIALVGVKKNYPNRTSGTGANQEVKKHFYDIENFTFDFTYTQADHTNYEVEMNRMQTVQTGFVYSYNIPSKPFQPLSKVKAKWLNKKYLRFIKDFNFNLLPSAVTFRTHIDRRFTNFRVRQIIDYGLDFPPMQSRDYKVNADYSINYSPFRSMNITLTGNAFRTVKNYFNPDGTLRYDATVWDGFFHPGDPYIMQQGFNLTYKFPFDKFPLINFISANYNYNGSFQWQRRPEVMADVDGYDLGNTIQNANTQQITGTVDLKKIYDFTGLTYWENKWSGKKVRPRKSKTRKKSRTKKGRAQTSKETEKAEKSEKETETKEKEKEKGLPGLAARNNEKEKRGGSAQKTTGRKVYFNPTKAHKAVASVLHVFTSVKRIRFQYKQTNGLLIPGYLPSTGYLGTLNPDIPFVLGWTEPEVRYELARKGWLTEYPGLNEAFMQNFQEQWNFSTNFQPVKNLKIDVRATRQYAKNYSETFRVSNRTYQPLVPTLEGHFAVSWLMLKTANEPFDPDNSPAIERMRRNSYVIASRLAAARGLPVPSAGYPDGYGFFQTDVLVLSFISAFTMRDPGKIPLTPFANVPVPNWKIKYTGLSRTELFRKHFKRFSLEHAYQSDLTVNRFRNNLEFFQDPQARDITGNYYGQLSFGDIIMTEQFNPLVRVQMEMKNNLQLDVALKKDRLVGLNTENYTLTHISGKEVVVGLGYRIKDVYLPLRLGGNSYEFRSDLIVKADFSYRKNLNVIYGFLQTNSQPVSGKYIYNFRFSADYAFSKNLSAILFYEHNYSRFAVSTSYPLTSIRAGFTFKYTFGN
ncbi:MAG: cell surface protein SprA [Chlorobi bacterium]|nr:cell surface protein SprA [Chlorobiota bacterium]